MDIKQKLNDLLDCCYFISETYDSRKVRNACDDIAEKVRGIIKEMEHQKLSEPRNYPEDYEQNPDKQYIVKCVHCKHYFYGHNGRDFCKVCAEELCTGCYQRPCTDDFKLCQECQERDDARLLNIV